MPDIGVFVISLLVFIACRKLFPPPQNEWETARELLRQHRPVYQHTESFFILIGELFMTALLALSGIAAPCVLSSVYFLSFLSISTWWACYQKLGKRFQFLRVGLLVYAGLHLIVEYLYQMQFFQEYIHPDTLLAR